MIHLRSVRLHRQEPADDSDNKTHPLPDVFPFSVPVIRSLTELTFTADVTFFVGENGSGKSTLLEAVAVAARLPTVGSHESDRDQTLSRVRMLADALRLTWSAKRHRGFFMRSEDFFGFVKRLAATRDELRQDLEASDREYHNRPKAAALARQAYARELNDLKQRYGDDLDTNSHGESYFKLFQSRFVPNGLYMMDEPEAPLSPMRQIIFLSMLRMMVGQDAQFIIATHSPILMAYPGAVILNFDKGAITRVPYENLDHVVITRTFLDNPARYLDRLFEDLPG